MKSIVYVLLLLGFLLLMITGCSRDQFKGNSISNDNEFTIEFEYLNGTGTHSLYLDKNRKLDVKIALEEGEIDILVDNNKGKSLFRGNKAQSGEFYLVAPEGGEYLINITGKKAKGKVSFLKVN